MTKAETLLRAELLNILDDACDYGWVPTKTVEHLVEAVKTAAGDLFVNNGVIKQVFDSDWVDYEDNYTQYSVCAEALEIEDRS